jgi:hypothetical protein
MRPFWPIFWPIFPCHLLNQGPELGQRGPAERVLTLASFRLIPRSSTWWAPAWGQRHSGRSTDYLLPPISHVANRA